MPWDQGLEGPSLQIAASDHSPLRVRAGPGTSKTFSLIRPIARIFENGTVCVVETTERKGLGIQTFDPAIRAASTGGAAC